MGCDIHLHTEILIDGRWHHYGAPTIQRSYKLFSKMAGVRSYPESPDPIVEPRGLPDDISFVTRKNAEYWEMDGHSYGWLSASEIMDLEDWMRNEGMVDIHPPFDWGYLFGNSFGGFAKYPDDRSHDIDDVRFVFWFDN